MNAPDFETLNAYVDGELAPAEAAEVARAVAGDPLLAHQVATLTRLKAAVVESIELPELDLPAAAPRVARRNWALAASLAFLLIGGSVLLSRAYDLPAAADWLAPAWRAHAAWSLPEGGGSAEGDSRSRLMLQAASFQRVDRAFVPDLTAAKLFVTHISQRDDLLGRAALVVGYAGTRGCKVTLVVAAAAAPLSDHLARYDDSPGAAYAWRAGELDYLLLAEGMDAKRFRLVAETVHRISIERLPLDDGTRVALQDSRRRSAPCLA
jgi:anti-sigma factor RsiW